MRAVSAGTPGGRGAGRPGTSMGGLTAAGLDAKLLGPGTLRGIGGAARGCSKLPS